MYQLSLTQDTSLRTQSRCLLSVINLSDSQSRAVRPAASPGNVLDMHTSRLSPHLTESETVGMEPSDLRFSKSPGDSTADSTACTSWRTAYAFQLLFTFFFSSWPHFLLSPSSWFPILMRGLPTLMEKMNLGPISSKLCTIEGTFPSAETS